MSRSGSVGCHPRLFVVAAFAARSSAARVIPLDSDALVAEIKKLRGKANPLSAAALKALRDEDTRTLAPSRVLAAEALTLE